MSQDPEKNLHSVREVREALRELSNKLSWVEEQASREASQARREASQDYQAPEPAPTEETLSPTEQAFTGLLHWLLTERSWAFFRAEFLNCGQEGRPEPHNHQLKNAQRISEYLQGLRGKDARVDHLIDLVSKRA